MEPNTNSQLSVSSLSAPPSNATTTSTNQGAGQEGNDNLRRQLVVDAPLIGNGDAPRKHRRSSKQKHLEESERTRNKNYNLQL